MSQVETSRSLETALRQKAVLARVEGTLVAWARELITSRLALLKGMEESQLRNVLHVSLSASHPLTVSAFIHYQMGRETGKDAWKNSGLGQAVRDKIDTELWKLLKDGDAKTEAEKAQLVLLMTRQFLGWLARVFVAHAEEVKKSKANNPAGGQADVARNREGGRR